MSITDSSRASTPYSGTLNHPAPHVPRRLGIKAMRGTAGTIVRPRCLMSAAAADVD